MKIMLFKKKVLKSIKKKPFIVNFSISFVSECRQILVEEWQKRKGLIPRTIENVNYVWKTNTGDLIPIEKMSQQHLDNCIKMAERIMLYESLEGEMDPVWDFGDR